MSNEETVEQLRAELTQMQLDANAVCQTLGIKWAQDGNYPEFAIQAIERLRGKWARREWERDEVQAKLEQTNTERIDETRAATLMRGVAQEQSIELAQARDELAAVDEALDEFYCPVLDENDEPCGSFYKDHGVNVMRQNLDRARSVIAARNIELTRALNERDETEIKLVQARAELMQVKRLWLNRAEAVELRRQLAQARQELSGLQGANRELGQHVTDVKKNRDYWYDKAVDAEAECDKMRKRAQEQSDEVQASWLSPAEAEGLKRQLAHAEAQIVSTREAVEWIWGFWDGNTLIARSSNYEEEIGTAWNKLLAASDAFSKSWEHHGGNAAKTLGRLAILDAAEAALADCGIDGIRDQFTGLADAIKQMADYLGNPERCIQQGAERHTEYFSRQLQVAKTDEQAMKKALQAERQLRRAAERRIKELEPILLTESAQHNYIEGLRDRLGLARKRATCAEALAALVTVELEETLEALAIAGDLTNHPFTADLARALAASIREALEQEIDDEG